MTGRGFRRRQHLAIEGNGTKHLLARECMGLARRSDMTTGCSTDSEVMLRLRKA